MPDSKRTYDSPRQAARRDAILSCARLKLSQVGYDGLTMRGLAEQAGVATSTLYNLFGNKDDLLLAAVGDLLAELTAAANAANAEGIDAILLMNKIGAAEIVRAPEYADAMTRSLLRLGADSRLVEVLFAGSYPFIAAHMEIAKTNGEISKHTDIEKAAKHFLGQQWGSVLLWMMGLLKLEELISESNRAQIMILISIAEPDCETRLRKMLRQYEKK